MSLKSLLIDEKIEYIPNFSTLLSMREECMLNYLIDLADYKDADYKPMEITCKFVQLKKPNWKERDIKEALKGLCKAGLIIQVKNHGRGNCYQLNIEAIQNEIARFTELKHEDNKKLESDCNFLPISQAESYNQIGKNLPQSITINNNINNKSKNNQVDVSSAIEQIINYLNIVTNSKFRYTAETTNKCIIARLNEGYTIDDFKKVIDNKSKDKFFIENNYLRPSTLFGAKFENYLNEKPKQVTSILTGNVKKIDNLEIRKDIIFT